MQAMINEYSKDIIMKNFQVSYLQYLTFIWYLYNNMLVHQ